MRISGIVILLLLFATACKKDEDLSSTPKIAWKAYGPKQIISLKDSIYFSFEYEDLDGDLGSSNSKDYNLFITDERFPLTYKFRISELVPDAEKVAIKGIINVTLSNTILSGTNKSEEVNYSLYLNDRTGHQSNTIRTSGMIVLE